MKHASIFTRLAQRADPNIPILEAAMEEIARLEEKLETSGYSPFTEEVEDILRSKNQNLFNALMESKKRTGEQAAEITRLKGVIAKCEAAIDSHLNPCGCFNGCEFCGGKATFEEAIAAIKEEGL